MQQTKNGVMRTVGILLALIGLMFGLAVSYYMYRPFQMDKTRFHGTWLDTPRQVADFNLEGTTGAFNKASLTHQWTMIFFGFTTCPSICPTTMVELAKMRKLLEKEGVKPLPQVVLVSLDPDQDTMQRLHDYVTAFHPQFLGVRSSHEAAVKAMANEMGVAYTKVALSDAQDKQHYNIEHTGTIMLFNPEGKLNAFFTMPHHAVSLANDYKMAILSFPRSDT